MNTTGRRQRGRAVFAGCAILLIAALFAGAAAGSSGKSRATAVSLTVGVLPIANTLPLDLGIKKGFFEQQGIEIKKITAQSGNDIMLGLANSNIDVGFAGWVPAMIARTSGIPISVVALSEVESTDQAIALDRGMIVHRAPSAVLRADAAALERYLGVSKAARDGDRRPQPSP